MSDSIIGGFRMLLYAYRECDQYEHYICDDGHEVSEEDGYECPICGAEIKFKPDRPLMLRLAKIQIKSATVPHRLFTFESDPTKKEEVIWYWRGRKLFSYHRPNSFAEWLP